MSDGVLSALPSMPSLYLLISFQMPYIASSQSSIVTRRIWVHCQRGPETVVGASRGWRAGNLGLANAGVRNLKAVFHNPLWILSSFDWCFMALSRIGVLWVDIG